MNRFFYIVNGKPTGFDVEIAMRFAHYAGMSIEFSLMDFNALIPAVQAGKANCAYCQFYFPH